MTARPARPREAMCGIAGEITVSGEPSAAAMAHALAGMAHRGPDGLGLMRRANIALGCTRLAISGPAIAAVPAFSDGCALALNGEIYGLGHATFDTAWLLRRITRTGLAALDHVDGMFALGLADLGAGQLTVARDPFGIKPMFVHRRQGSAAFASELAALARMRDADPVVGPAAALEYLGLGAPLGHGTLLRDVASLAAGERWTFTAAGGRLAAHRDVAPQPREPASATLAEALEASVLACADTRQPVGLFLSGGLDSTAIAAVLSRHGVQDLHTFSLVLGRDGVRDLAELGLPGTAWRTWRHCGWTPPAAAVEAAFRRVLGFTSYPCFPASAAYMLLLAQRAAQAGVRVVLVGEGADELFAGYSSYLGLDASRPVESFYLGSEPMRLAAELVAGGDAAAAGLRARLAALAAAGGPRTEQLLAMERPLSLAPLLARVDETTMRAGIEARVPFLHGDVPGLALKAAARLPPLHRLGRTKPALRDELAPLVGGRAGVPKRPLRVPASFFRETAIMASVLESLHDPGPLPLRRSALDGLRAAARGGATPAAVLVALRVHQLASFVRRFSSPPPGTRAQGEEGEQEGAPDHEASFQGLATA